MRSCSARLRLPTLRGARARRALRSPWQVLLAASLAACDRGEPPGSDANRDTADPSITTVTGARVASIATAVYAPDGVLRMGQTTVIHGSTLFATAPGGQVTNAPGHVVALSLPDLAEIARIAHDDCLVHGAMPLAVHAFAAEDPVLVLGDSACVDTNGTMLGFTLPLPAHGRSWDVASWRVDGQRLAMVGADVRSGAYLEVGSPRLFMYAAGFDEVIDPRVYAFDAAPTGSPLRDEDAVVALGWSRTWIVGEWDHDRDGVWELLTPDPADPGMSVRSLRDGLAVGGWSGPRVHDATATGDLTGDGVADLAFAGSWPSAEPGGPEPVTVFVTSAAPGPADDPSRTIPLQIRNVADGGFLGAELASGDVNGDGRADLVVSGSAPGLPEAVRLFLGPLEERVIDAAEADATVWGNRRADFFGHAPLLADLTGDGMDDLIVTALYENRGTIYVIDAMDWLASR